MTTFDRPQLPRGYLSWQRKFTHEFFDNRADQPVVMFIDIDELQRLADSGEDAMRSLASAVEVTIQAVRLIQDG